MTCEAELNANVQQQYPEVRERRRRVRHRLHWPVAISLNEEFPLRTVEGATHDISIAGCSVLTDDRILHGDMITVRLILPLAKVGATRQIVEVKARVVYTIRSTGGTKFRSGIEFALFSENSGKLLERAIELRTT
jgi:c-di-GMP-binding flagellar brake protein YcgR